MKFIDYFVRARSLLGSYVHNFLVIDQVNVLDPELIYRDHRLIFKAFKILKKCG